MWGTGHGGNEVGRNRDVQEEEEEEEEEEKEEEAVLKVRGRGRAWEHSGETRRRHGMTR